MFPPQSGFRGDWQHHNSQGLFHGNTPTQPQHWSMSNSSHIWKKVTSAVSTQIWLSQSSYSINSGHPRAIWALLHSSGLYAMTSPWVGTPLKVTQGWEIPCCIRSLVTNGTLNFETADKQYKGLSAYMYPLDVNCWLNLSLDPAAPIPLSEEFRK